jgi:hypothetical protein
MQRALLPTLIWVMVLVGMTVAQPARLDLPGPDKAALAAEDAGRDDGGPDRFAWPYDLSLAPRDGEGWTRLNDGSHRWQLVIEAPGSLSLGFGFRRYRIPWGAELVIRGERGPERRFTAADVASHGQLWTPVVLGDEAELTLTLPPGHRDDFELELARVGRGYRLFGEDPWSEADANDKQGPCNIDVICPEGDPWRKEIRSVGVYTLGGVWDCTGVMINNTARDETPYFLTANHCDVDEENAATVVVYWNFESPECGLLSGGSLEDAQSGAIWRASYFQSDMTLLELSAPPDTSWHVTYAGWDRSGATPAAAVAIHHPSTDEKAISFENDPLSATGYLINQGGDLTHWRVEDWDLGTTEPGSSGSPLFDPQRRIVGQLHGGQAACGNDLPDWYGRFDVSWSGGGTPATQLAHWLDPVGAAPLTLNTFDPLDPDDPDDPDGSDVVVLAGPFGNPVRPGEPAVLRVELPEEAQATVKVYDLRGRCVATLHDGVLPTTRTIVWDGRGLAAGVYFVRLEALGHETSAALTLLR